MTDFVDKHRADLLDLLVRNGDIRRATVAAIRPLAAGAITTSDLFERKLTDDDVDRLKKLASQVSRAASNARLRTALKALVSLADKAEGKRIGAVFDLKL
jgi:GAF domain-containing protein